jgi:hypothetical protein
MTMPQYTYRVFDAQTVRQFFYLPRFRDSYISEDQVARCLREALEDGFRWVRTEGDYAIFEKQVS